MLWAPNRVGQIGTWHLDADTPARLSYVELDGEVLSGHRTFATADTAGDLWSGQRLKVALSDASDASVWIIQNMIWDGSYLRWVGGTQETSSAENDSMLTLFADGASLEVRIVPTADFLTRCNALWAGYFYGTDYWTAREDQELVFDADNDYYEFDVDSGVSLQYLDVSGTWPADLDVRYCGLWVYLPEDMTDDEIVTVIIEFQFEDAGWMSQRMWPGATAGAWNWVEITMTPASPSDEVKAFRLRLQEGYFAVRVTEFQFYGFAR